MIVCYDNILISSTLTATNENVTRQIENIYHNYMELAFYSQTDNVVITAIFDNVEDIDHVAFGYHNLDSMSIAFYDSLNNLLNTIVIDVTNQIDIQYFTKIEDVKKVIITCTSLAYELYIGSIFIGESLGLPRFQQALEVDINLYDNNFTSGGGQHSGNRKRNLKSYKVDFANIDNDDKEIIEDYLIYVQGSIPHFIDFYPDAHTNQLPIYGAFQGRKVNMPKRRISDFKWNASLFYKEAK